MTILVDVARWPWRETLWCHLVSDSNFEELHTFAARLGCRRVGFQGDHYDIDIGARAVAVECGAQEHDSRELVRRLRAADLRVRPSTFEKWQLDERSEGALSRARADELRECGSPMLAAALDQLESVPNIAELRRECTGWFALKRSQMAAIVLHGPDSAAVDALDGVVSGDDAEHGIFVRTDKLGPSSGWSVESISPGPHPNQ